MSTCVYCTLCTHCGDTSYHPATLALAPLFFCSGLKSLITPVLAGLLESDIAKMSSFEHFFATIEHISKMKVNVYVKRIICIHKCNVCIHIHVYLANLVG